MIVFGLGTTLSIGDKEVNKLYHMPKASWLNGH